MPVVRVDYTHVGRRASGIERVTTEQFSGAALAPLTICPFRAPPRRLGIVAAQTVLLPMHAVRHPSDVFVFPGFPPSPYFAFVHRRAVLYVHDLFLLTRRAYLNGAAKYYMAPLFSIAVRRLRYFLTNSQETARQLRGYCSPAATVLPYRPRIRNVFDLAVGNRAERGPLPERLRIVSIGTIEPRKNFTGAADISEALGVRLRRPVEHHIVGRFGWGEDAKLLQRRPHVVLHGSLSDAAVRPIVEAADILLCTSHDEGLGLPLLEAQYSGILVAAPDTAVFREVVDSAGVFIDTGSPLRAAEQIAAAMADGSWRPKYMAFAVANVARWNAIAENDRAEVIGFLSRLRNVSGNCHG